jgi:hypothetical protein
MSKPGDKIFLTHEADSYIEKIGFENIGNGYVTITLSHRGFEELVTTVWTLSGGRLLYTETKAEKEAIARLRKGSATIFIDLFSKVAQEFERGLK